MVRKSTCGLLPLVAVVCNLPWLVGSTPARGEEADDKTSVETVAEVDLTRYSGLWYEVAKIPNRFQKHCVSGATAEYVPVK